MDYIITHRNVYDNLAHEYEERIKDYFDSTSKAVSFVTPHIKTGREVLDVGCGVGLGTELLSKCGFDVTAIDISPKMVEFSKKRNPSSTIIEGDFLTHSFNKKFDAIFSMAFIHLFPKKDAERVLQKIFKLLKKEGVLFFGTTLSKESKEGWEIKRDPFFLKSEQKRYRKHWTEKELLDLLIKSGFSYIDRYFIDDPRGKVWMDFLVQKP
jgi:2-polyprenyl-3-methyl-5-hydroxy-6-metoxy-1,4-benzoquinol methylase